MQKLLIATVVLVGLVALVTLVSAVPEADDEILREWWEDANGNWVKRKLTPEEITQQWERWETDASSIAAANRVKKYPIWMIFDDAKLRRDEFLNQGKKQAKKSWFSRKL